MDPSDAQLRQLLEEVRTIAVVGIKSGAGDDAYRVPRYMQQHGYRILPVSPKLTLVLEEPAWPPLADVDERVDLPGVPEDVAGHTHLGKGDDVQAALARFADEREHTLDVEIRTPRPDVQLREPDARTSAHPSLSRDRGLRRPGP